MKRNRLWPVLFGLVIVAVLIGGAVLWKKRAAQIEAGFSVEGGRLNTENEEVLEEPLNVLRLFALAEKHALVLYLSNASDTFHPKIYAFQNGKQCSVIVGSANLTHGGFYGNYEASALVDDASGALMASVTQHFDALVADRILVPATKPRIDEYEREFLIHDTCRKVAKKRAQKASRTEGPDRKSVV